jgi:hypothetical protein
MPLSTMFQLLQAVSFIGGRKPEYLEKTNDLPHITVKLYLDRAYLPSSSLFDIIPNHVF